MQPRTHNGIRNALVIAAFASACGGSEESAVPPVAVTPVAAPPSEGTPPAVPATEARAAFEEPSFTLRSDVSAPVQAAAESHFGIRLEARGGFHVNPDYPISVQLTGPEGVQFPHATLGRPEAAEFSESVARFDVPFSASSGHHEVRALVDFVVCTAETCVPDMRTLAIALDVP